MTKSKILIIDDDPDIALATRLCLESKSYEVFEAHNSVEGLRLIEQNRPDLIVLDVMMDSTTEGFQLALTLRSPDPESAYRAYRDIPIIMLTSIHSTTPIRFGPDEDYLPVDCFLEKPLNSEEFLSVVANLLHET